VMLFPEKNYTARVDNMLSIIISEEWEIEELHDTMNEFFCTLEYSNWLPANFFKIHDEQLGISRKEEKIDPRNVGRTIPDIYETARMLIKILPKKEVFNQFKELEVETIFEFLDFEGNKQIGEKINEEYYLVSGRDYFYTLLNNKELTIIGGTYVEQEKSR